MGLIPVMLTPFRADGGIDYGSLDALIDFYLVNDSAGLFANCLSSEMYELSPTERLKLVRYIVKRASGAVPVVATGTFGGTVTQQADFVRQMADTGVDAVVVITSLMAQADEPDETLLERMDALLQQTGSIPLGLYECPVPYKRLLTPSMLAYLSATGRVHYHKDTSCDTAAVAAKLAVVSRPTFGFYDAHLPNAVASLRLGASGLSPIAANYFPEITAWLCRQVDTPAEQENVAWLQNELTRINALIHQHYPAGAKQFLRDRGLPLTTVCRTSSGTLPPDHRSALQLLHRHLAEWQERLNMSRSGTVSLPHL